MARKVKQSLEYFPFDVGFFDDDKLLFVAARFGNKGELFTVKLLCKIYSDKGYYCKWSEDEALLFSKRVGYEATLVNDIVSELIKRDFFNEYLFNSFKILTSKGIQERYFEVKSRNKKEGIINEYLINDTIKQIDVATIPINATSIPQSKVKESKVNQSKENEITAPQELRFHFKLKEVVHYQKISEYFQINYQLFLEQFIMKYGLEIVDQIYEVWDLEKNGYCYNSENHIQNMFNGYHKKIINENEHKSKSNNYTGAKESVGDKRAKVIAMASESFERLAKLSNQNNSASNSV